MLQDIRLVCAARALIAVRQAGSGQALTGVVCDYPRTSVFRVRLQLPPLPHMQHPLDLLGLEAEGHGTDDAGSAITS